MNIIDTGPIEQSEIEKNPREILLDTAIAILQYRIDSLQEDIPWYIQRQKQRINILENEKCKPLEEAIDPLKKTITEALFFIEMRQSSIPITVSTAEEDMEGIDFYIHDIPVDVTTKNETPALEKKLEKQKVAILILPMSLEQKQIRPSYSNGLIVNAFLENRLTAKGYLNMVLKVNRNLKWILIENLPGKHENIIGPRIKGSTDEHINRLRAVLWALSGLLE